jgi:DNA-directed RNA polymerase alpha subunit/DNA-directed RNA polymerase specialized sigma subunit
MKDDLYSALQYLRSGRTQEARQILVAFIETNRKNPHAWFLLSFAVKNKEHKRDCLQRVLEIDPNHVKAKKRLAGLGSSDALVSTSIEQLPNNVNQLTQFNSPRTNTLPSNESNIERPVLDDVVEKWFSVLSFRERTILENLYLNTDRFSIEAVGRITSVSTEKVKQIHQRAIDKLLEAASSDPLILELVKFLCDSDEFATDAEVEVKLRNQFEVHEIDPIGVFHLISTMPMRRKRVHSQKVAFNTPKDKSLVSEKTSVTIQLTEVPEHPVAVQQNPFSGTEDKTPISALNLSKRSYNALQRASVKTIGQLIALYPEDIWEVRNLGVKSIKEISSHLQDYLRQNSVTLTPTQISRGEQKKQVVEIELLHIQEKKEQSKVKAYKDKFIPLLQDKTPIASLNLRRRTYNAIFRSEISTINQLVALSPKELWRIKNIGEKSVREIEKRLDAYLHEYKETDIEQNTTSRDTEDVKPIPVIDRNLLKAVAAVQLTKIPVTRLGLSQKEHSHLVRLGISSIGQLLDSFQESMPEDTVIEQLNRYLAWFAEQSETAQESEIKNIGLSPLYQIDLAQITIETLFDQWLGILKGRARQIVSWRFGLHDEPLTLQQIGEHIQVTRERVRQIEKRALSYLRSHYEYQKSTQLRPFLVFLHQLFFDHGGLLSQSEIIELLEKEGVVRLGNINPLGVFLLISELDEQFSFYKSEEFAALSTYSVDTISQVQGCYKDILSKRLTGISRSTLLKDFRKSSVYQELESALPEEFFQACLRVHPEIERLKSGLYSLSKASSKRLGAIVTAMREMGEPAHYSVIAEKTNALLPAEEQFTERALHAKLGQHPDVFVWTRLRGTYGLKEWGLEQGLSYVDAIEKILLEENRPLTFEQVIQRLPKYREFFDEGSVIITLGTHEKFKNFSNNTYGLSHWNTSKSEFDFGDMFGEQLAQRQLELDRRNNNAAIDTQSEVEKIRRIGLDFFTS